MIVETRGIGELVPNPQNPRKISKKAINAVKKSIKEFGYCVPIVIDENNMILAGHTRCEALKASGVEEVQVVVAKNLTEEQKKVFNIIDNKMVEYNDWDNEKLAELIQGIEKKLMDFGFEEEELTDLLGGGKKKANKIPIVTETDIQVGDIYNLDGHKVICGDSTDARVYNRLLGDEKVKLCFTSPPYNMGAKLYEEYKDNKGSEEYVQFNKNVIANVKNHLEGFLFWNISYNKNTRNEFIDILHHIKELEGMRFLELVVWDKGHGIPITSRDILTRTYEDIFVAGTDDSVNADLDMFSCSSTGRRFIFNKKTRKALTNYWQIGTQNTQIKGHEACYPVELPERGISIMSDINDIVIDPFGGSGTTLIACERLKRKARLIELSPLYCAIIIKRWEEYTGKKAIKA